MTTFGGGSVCSDEPNALGVRHTYRDRGNRMTSAAVQDTNEGATMLLYRVSKGVRDHAFVRRSEWVCAIVALWWGVALLLPGDTMLKQPSLRGFLHLFSETTWAWIFFVVGFLRIAALVINGTFAGTAYSKYSPDVRAVCAGVGCLLYLGIVFGILFGPEPLFPLSTGLGAYAAFACLDYANALGTSKEAGWSRQENATNERG